MCPQWFTTDSQLISASEKVIVTGAKVTNNDILKVLNKNQETVKLVKTEKFIKKTTL